MFFSSVRASSSRCQEKVLMKAVRQNLNMEVVGCELT